MFNLRELLAITFSSSDLSNSEFRETAIDRIGAIAFADPLGESLWRWKYGRERSQAPVARALLSLQCKGIIYSRDIRLRLCGAVLQEWWDDNCQVCGGRRFIMATDSTPSSMCTVCDGTGKRCYSDQWRMSQMDFSPETYRKWERRFVQAHEKITDADAKAWRDVALRLERIGGPAAARKALEFSKKKYRLNAVQCSGPGETYERGCHVALGTAA